MAEITAELDLEISKFRSALGQANKRLGSFASQGEKRGRGLGGNLAKGFKAAFLPALAGIGGLVAAAGVGKILMDSLKEAANQEQLEVSFEVLVGNKDEAGKLLDQLRQDAATTPLQFADLGDAAKKLLAFGAAADEVPGTLRRIGDISSAIGAPIGEIAELYGKAQVQGTLFAEDINQLTGRGIPVLQEFAKQLGVDVGQVKKLGSQGKISFDNLQQAFVDLTASGAQFGGMMEKQSGTLTGLWSTLKDQFSILRLEIGKPFGNALKPILQEAIGLVTSMKDEAAAVGKALGDGVTFARTALQELSGGDILRALAAGLELAFKTAANTLYTVITATFAELGSGDALDGFKVAMMAMADDFGKALLGAVGEAAEAVKKVWGDLVAADINDIPLTAKGRKVVEEFDAAGGLGGEAAKRSEAAGKKQLFDTSGAKASLELLLRPVRQRLADEEFERERQRDLQLVKDAEATDAKLAAAKASQLPQLGGSGFASGGPVSLQNAVNSIFGKDQIPERALAVAQDQSRTMRDVAATLKRIENQKPKPPRRPVPGRPAFAAG